MLSGIAWVSELIEIAGGIDIFADRSAGKSAKERIATAEEIIARRPDIIIGSWCGKKFRPEKLAARAGFEQIPAVRNRALRARGSMGGQKNLAGYRWFESISLQQTVSLSPAAAFGGSRNPLFRAVWGSWLADRVSRDSQGVSISRQPAAISLSGHIPVPQCR